ncbi:YciI family protein [Arenibacter sp. F26102]|uniref:YciI family protein n=1 Tax=Arenibacter sp. F26102 TaxID=2926416 RepID=UPI001FF669A8|nr:YciI family protein [Arenibacter sp. F26102]MCK0145301.1 YciI family protein [Arenibacter sp. F26102]
MKQLQDYMLLFRMQPSEQQPTQEQVSQMQQQWGTFIGGIASQAKLISTSRLGFEGILINPSLEATNCINISNNQTLMGNMVVKASSLSEASEIAKGCPVLSLGGSVEVRNIIPMQT